MCELVGLIDKLENVIYQPNIDLYPADGLAIMDGSGPKVERLRYKILKKMGLNVTIKSNIKFTHFQKDNQNPLFIL